MMLFAYIAIFGLLGGAWSDSSEENNGAIRCNHGEGRINYKTGACTTERDNRSSSPDAPPLPVVAQVAPGSCGVRRTKKSKLNSDWKRIIPGLPVQTFYGEAPWMVRIIADGKFVCGGTLIAPKAVLTAAHCLNDKDVTNWSVEVGEWNASSEIEPNPTQKQKAQMLIIHKEFNYLNSANNVAIIFVKTPFVLSETVGIMCLADSLNMIDPQLCFATGWGKDGQGRNHTYSPVLRKVNLPVMPNDQCQTKLRTTFLGDRFELLPGFVCAGGVDSRDTCQGDGGGPLYCEMKSDPNRFALYGIIAWGIGCGETNPTVFTSVPRYIDWITSTLEKFQD